MRRSSGVLYHGSDARDGAPPLAQRLLAFALALALRALGATWRVRWERPLPEGPWVLATLHEDLLACIHALRGEGVTPMISRSRDGELAARAVAWLGMSPVRGSSSAGGAEALEAALAAARRGGRPWLVSDGPRGPRGAPKAGAVVIAARAGLPLLALRARARWAWRLSSWDRGAIPLPFARVELSWDRVDWAPPAGVEAGRRALAEALVGGGPRARPG